MEKIHKEVALLVDMVNVLKESIYQHNPAINSTDKIALPTLAADAGTIIVRFSNLRVDILNIHEKEQIDEHNSNG